jgi:hypothetical protein
MVELRRGVWLPLTPARKLVLEAMHHARKVPSLPDSRNINVAPLAEARRSAESPPSWMTIFMRAYCLTALRHPELRRAFIPWPRPHLYEHPQSEGVILVEREWQGETIVLAARIRAPESRTLADIDGRLRYFQEAPVLEVNYFRQLLRLGRLPGFVRRFTFWHSLYLSGFVRAKRMGTFSISSLGSLGAEQHHPITPLTSYFTFGPIAPGGDVTAKIIYDHRVLDARCAARCLQTLDEVLHTTLLAELRGARREAAA